MEKIYFVVLAVILVISGAAPALADDEDGKRYLTEKVDGKSLKEFKEKGCEILKKHSKIASLRCPEAVANELNLREDIKVYAFDINADRQIGADIVWNLGYTGTNRTISVIDTGINYNHSELSDSYAGGWNFIADNNNPFDDNGHGTHVSGIITSNGNAINSKGVAPDAKILALKVLDSAGSGDFFDVIAAIYFTVDGPDGIYGTSDDFNADAISMSLGTGFPYLYTGSNCDYVIPEVTNAVNYAVSRGVTVVAASGNSGTQGVSLPGCISSAIAVGAVNNNDVRASFSGAGYSLDIVAPGVDIYSTWLSGYSTQSGTSMATPHVSAVVALLKQANNSLSVSAVKNALYNTAKNLGTAGWDPYYGSGRVNALAAVNSVLPPIHDVAVSSISVPSSVTKGSVVAISVAVKNEGNQPETFNVTVSDVTDSWTIGSKTVSLSAGATQNLDFSFNTSSSSIGDHTLKAEAIPVSGEIDAADNVKTASIAVTEPLVNPKMHIASINMTTEKDSNKLRAVATVTVVNETDYPVSGVNVYGHWSNLTSDSDIGTTDSFGKVILYSNWKKNPKGTFTFTVDNLVKSGWMYNSSANVETSDSITVYSILQGHRAIAGKDASGGDF